MAGRRHWLIPLSLLVAAILAASPAAAGSIPDPAVVPSLAPVLRQALPAVVNIATRSRVEVDNPLLRDPFFRQFFGIPRGPVQRETQASGSGVIVDAAHGYILTNNHVVQGAERIEVTTKDNRRLQARMVGHDEATDVAVLKVAADHLAALPIGDSDALQVGDYVVAIGNPFGLGQTATSGIVSALGRSGLGIEGYEDFIQTDASINPGNSGGALINLKGQLIGINTAILAPGGGNVGIGFAVPINMAKVVMQELIQNGRISRGRIGVAIQDLTPDLAESLNVDGLQGAVVSRVEAGSPADRAGLRAGDVVTAVDGQPVRSASQLRNRIGLARVGQRIELSASRRGESHILTVVVAKASPREQSRQPSSAPDEEENQ